MSTVIKVENLSKQYRLGLIGSGTLREDLEGWWYRIRGKEDPTLMLGEVNDRTTVGKSNYVWALRDINFEVQQGEVLGIIGKNGAGKSTLLKLLSRVTAPTTGHIKAKGRIASLLEVGTGFHPELTGRENIYLNGAIMGMKKHEITRKLDEIIDFAGVERYLETPVKRYSSGMYVRLAFAVAAHLEPEILIVDEVLAVGDAEFQKKALGKMKEVSSGQGRTVLFVSHNMASVKSLCTRSLLLKNGGVAFEGSTTETIQAYLGETKASANKILLSDNYIFEELTLHSVELNPKGGTSEDALDEYQEIELHTKLTVNDGHNNLHLTYVLNNDSGDPLFTFSHANSIGIHKLRIGINHLVCRFPKGFLNIGQFILSVYIIEDSKRTVFSEEAILTFNVQEGERPLGAWMGKEPGYIKPNFEWQFLSEA